MKQSIHIVASWMMTGVLATSFAYAQHDKAAQAAPHAENRTGGPFDMQVYGNFRKMQHQGDLTGKVRLQDLNAGAGSYGLGAIAGLSGEVMLWDGKLLVSRGESATGQVEIPRAGEEAALFVSSHVPRWIEVPVPRDMTQQEFEAFVVEAAGKNGIAADQPFPFAVRGKFSRMLWHVVTGTDKSGHQGKAEHDGKRLFDQAGVSGTVLGFYAGAALEGVISHPGERFHLHYADAGWSVAGHVESYAVSQAETLMLPAR